MAIPFWVRIYVICFSLKYIFLIGMGFTFSFHIPIIFQDILVFQMRSKSFSFSFRMVLPFLFILNYSESTPDSLCYLFYGHFSLIKNVYSAVYQIPLGLLTYFGNKLSTLLESFVHITYRTVHFFPTDFKIH